MPIVSAPLAAASAATTELSTPPDIATTMRHSAAGRGRSNKAAASDAESIVGMLAGAFTAAAHTRGARTTPELRGGDVLIERNPRLYRFLTPHWLRERSCS